ncbi:MAG TPA: hypothetical protein EYP17_00400, partial [Candidatus Latescibacteria bacterium]|nr:hypothetical protein [Candidatus Latescibacterota bacterium]
MLFVPEDGRPIVRFRVSWRGFWTLAGCAGALALFALVGVSGYWWAFRQSAKVRRLEEENARLSEENRKVEELAEALARVQEFRMRLVAALGGRELQ